MQPTRVRLCGRADAVGTGGEPGSPEGLADARALLASQANPRGAGF